MSDPLGLIGNVGGAGAAGRIGVRPPSGPQEAGGASFKDVLMENISEVNRLQQEVTQTTEDFATGKRQDLEGVILATQKADAAFRMLVSVRNKMQTAFEEIKQLRV